jgi:hypothetical protein
MSVVVIIVSRNESDSKSKDVLLYPDIQNSSLQLMK